MNNKTFLIGNWKMNHGIAATTEYCQQLAELSTGLKKTELKIAPPFLSIASATSVAKESQLQIGVQNVHWAENGAYTGEISCGMALEAGATFALIGHSERRQYFGENDHDVLRRTRAAMETDLLPVVCIGETLEEREAGKTDTVLRTQLEGLFTYLSSDEAPSKPLILAYEPVWAIGTGKVPTLEDITDTHRGIIEYWKSFNSTAPCPPILYGGSVSPDNFGEISKIEEVAGALVGGASLVYEKFSKLAEIAEG